MLFNAETTGLIGFSNGLADGNLSNIDTSDSSNEFCSSGACSNFNASTSNPVDSIPDMTGPSTNGVTVSASNYASGYEPWDAFDDTTSTHWRSGDSYGHWLQIEFPSPVTIHGWSFNTEGNGDAPDDSLNLNKSDDGVSWTQIDNQPGVATNNYSFYEFFTPQFETARFFRINVSAGNKWTRAREIELYLVSISELDLHSDVFSASFQPESADVGILVGSESPYSLNTDISVSVSRDGGTTWTQGTLTDAAPHISSAGVKPLVAQNIDLSSQPSGTDMRWRIETSNNAEFTIDSVYFEWN